MAKQRQLFQNFWNMCDQVRGKVLKGQYEQPCFELFFEDKEGPITPLSLLKSWWCWPFAPSGAADTEVPWSLSGLFLLLWAAEVGKARGPAAQWQSTRPMRRRPQFQSAAPLGKVESTPAWNLWKALPVSVGNPCDKRWLGLVVLARCKAGTSPAHHPLHCMGPPPYYTNTHIGLLFYQHSPYNQRRAEEDTREMRRWSQSQVSAVAKDGFFLLKYISRVGNFI